MNIIKTSFLLWTLISSVLFAQEILNRESILDSIVAVVDEGVVLESQLNTQIDIVKQRAEKDGFELPERKIIEEQIMPHTMIYKKYTHTFLKHVFKGLERVRHVF